MLLFSDILSTHTFTCTILSVYTYVRSWGLEI